MPMTVDDLRGIALAIPEVEEGTSYGTIAFKVRKKLLCRLRDDDEVLVLKCDPIERDALLAENGGPWFITPHYKDYGYVLVRLADADPAEVRELIVEAWLREAPRRLVAEHEAGLLGRRSDPNAGEERRSAPLHAMDLTGRTVRGR